MRLIAFIALIAGPATAGDYSAAVPDLNAIACVFRAVTDPPIPATGVNLIRNPNDPLGYIWVEEGLAPLPVLAIFRLPDTPGALTSISSVDLGGQFGMITYDPTGAARLSRHLHDSKSGIAWTSQGGTCIETKGA